MSGGAAAMAGARASQRNSPRNDGTPPPPPAPPKRKLKRKKTILQSMKDETESAPVTDTTRAQLRICCESPMSSKMAMVFHLLFGCIILLSLVAMAGETLNHDGKLFPNNLPPHRYKLMEMIFTVIFLIDLVFRGCIADRFVVQRRYPEHMEVRLPFFRDVLNWFDFLSILPFPIDTMVSIVYKGSRVPKFIRLLSVF